MVVKVPKLSIQSFDSQKKSVNIGLADRSIQLSDTEYRKNVIEKAKDALKLNNYTNNLINTIF